MADKRQMNEIWMHSPRKGEFYIFGRKGSGKNSVVVTIDSAKTIRSAKAKLAKAKQKYWG